MECIVGYEASTNEWFRFNCERASKQRVRKLESKGNGLPRAVSMPYLKGTTLHQEVKWVGWSDSEYTVLSAEELLETFGLDTVYLEWLSDMHDDHIIGRAERKALRAMMTTLPVECIPGIEPGECIFNTGLFVSSHYSCEGVMHGTVTKPSEQEDLLCYYGCASISILLRQGG